MNRVSARARCVRSCAILLAICHIGFIGFRSDARHSDAWRQQQEADVAVVILRDVIEMPSDLHDPTDLRTAFCVYVGRDSTARHDPPESVLASLRKAGLDVYPLSACDGWTVPATGAKAAILGVSSFDWKSDELVRAEAEVHLGILAGGTWLYQLSDTPQGWRVDTAQADKIY